MVIDKIKTPYESPEAEVTETPLQSVICASNERHWSESGFEENI